MVSMNFIVFLTSFIGIFFILVREVVSVAVTEVRLLSDSDRKEYVLQGEGATLTCHFALEPSEEVTEVEWEKDGVLVYVWTVDNPPVAYDILKDHVDLKVQSPSTLSITKVTIGMEGSYTCRVRTNGKRAQNDAYVMVIIDACQDSAWKTHTDMVTCTETINMHCVGMFPKPSPACGIYSETTGKYLSSVPFDSVIALANKTFEVSFNRRFTVYEWLNHTDISFRCYMLVRGTPWRTGIRHRMFGDPGCSKPPAKIQHGYYNMTDEKSCWGYPADGAKAEYHCDEGFQLLGSALHVCKDGEWVAEGVVVEGDYEVPVCSGFSKICISTSLYFVALILIKARQWT